MPLTDEPGEVRYAHAKVNLFLRIVGRRDDGSHDIETLFQKIGLCDRLIFRRTDRGFQLECRGLEIAPTPGTENLAARAYQALARHAGKPLGGVRIILEKVIPPGGGLGGGSSDAAAALLGLNHLFDLQITPETLRDIAGELGADVPFFLGPPTAIGRERGDLLAPLRHTSRFWVALALPDCAVSTAAVYGRYDSEGTDGVSGDLEGLSRALSEGNLARALERMFNEMEGLTFAIEPSLGELRERLEASARRPVRMSGSGSTLFTLAESEGLARRIAAKWRDAFDVRTAVAPFILAEGTCRQPIT